MESFFALLKRSNYGIHHHMGRKYLGRYCAERDFVYNRLKLTDDTRSEKAIKAARGKRLMLNGPNASRTISADLTRIDNGSFALFRSLEGMR